MNSSIRVLVAVACLTILVQPFAYPMPGRNTDKEEKLSARIEREKNPGKKARLQIRLAKLKLNQADAAYNHEDFAQGKALLQQYFEQIKGSWDTLQGTENGPRKHSRAFMDLEISLREDGRHLEDLRHRVPYPESEFIKSIQEKSSSVHNQVLEALFPDGFQRKERSKRSMPPKSSVTAKVGAVAS
jgi:hypothetical protein